MTMKINCDKCGYILGGIEVKENYGCNACNPFYLSMPLMKDTSIIGGNTYSAVNSEPVIDSLLQGTTCRDCGHINGAHLDKCPQSNRILEDVVNEYYCPYCKRTSNTVKMTKDDCPFCNPIPKVPTRPPLPIKYCGICGMILIQTPIATYYNHDTAEQYNHWRFRCPQYRWWKVWDRYHSNWRCDEDGSTYAYEI